MKRLQDRYVRMRAVALLTVAILMLSRTASADEHNVDELAKKLVNPIASLISVPFQFNPDFDIGSEDGNRTTLNIQPVIPASISENWNLITRVITPVIYQDDVFGHSGSQFGLGDMTPTFFFSPKAPTASGLTWGAGPVFMLPTATDDLLGSEKWGSGPSFVLLQQTASHWTIGMLANHIWSFAGDDDRQDVNNTYLQPFISKGIGKGRTLALNTESSYNWRTGHWNIPINATFAQIVNVGKQIVNLKIGPRFYIETPGKGPDWGFRFEVTLLFPR
jgi:Putative MetA-pathway of phenol degradation